MPAYCWLFLNCPRKNDPEVTCFQTLLDFMTFDACWGS